MALELVEVGLQSPIVRKAGLQALECKESHVLGRRVYVRYSDRIVFFFARHASDFRSIEMVRLFSRLGPSFSNPQRLEQQKLSKTPSTMKPKLC